MPVFQRKEIREMTGMVGTGLRLYPDGDRNDLDTIVGTEDNLRAGR